MNFISVFAFMLALPGLADCNHWPTQTLHSQHAPPLSTSAVSSAAGIAANSASVPAPSSSSSGAVGAGALSANHANHCRNLLAAIIVLSVLLGILLLVIMSLVLCPCLRRYRRGVCAQNGAIHVENSLPTQTLGKPGTESKILVADVPSGPPSDDRALARAPDAFEFTPGQDEMIHPEVVARAAKGTLTKEAVTQMVPMKPRSGLVKDGYNLKLDEKRPETIKEYFKNYRILFVIDDSSSMRVHWEEARDALSEIANHALEFHSDAVDIRFFNNPQSYNNVKGAQKITNIFGQVSLQRGTPTGDVLRRILNQQIDRLDTAYQHGSYDSEPLLDIIVITDGLPSPDSQPAPVIAHAAKQLRIRKHHPNSIGIQFVQIGNSPSAEQKLLSLVDGDYDMVDTISYSLYKEQGNGKLTAEVLIRIVLGGIHPNLRAYWNQYRRRENQGNL